MKMVFIIFCNEIIIHLINQIIQSINNVVKMKNIKIYLILFLFVGVFMSCNYLQEPKVQEQNKFEQVQVAKNANVLLSSEVDAIEIQKIIAKIRDNMDKNDANHKSQLRNNYSLSTIYNKNGAPSIYVANFYDNQGFVLVGASRDFEPVLAFAPTGSFPNTGNMPEPLNAWVKGTIDMVSQAELLPDTTKMKYRKKWHSVMIPSSNPTLTNSSNLRNAIWQNQVMAWINAGYTIHYITDSQITGNSQIDELMREYARDGVYYDYDWRSYAVVVESNPGSYEQTNLMQTVWTQNNHYNDSCPVINGQNALVGCGPLAMGQVMRYFQYPNTINWSNMPNSYSTSTTAQFLHQVGVACKANYSGGTGTTKINNVKSALSAYGYHVNKGSHSASRTLGCLRSGQPVIMTGKITKFDENEAYHAWVASGYYYDDSRTRYELFVMETPTVITSAYVYETNISYSGTYFYMNWGWGPNGGNGYYLNGYELNHETNSHPVYPISDRENLYDIYPNY